MLISLAFALRHKHNISTKKTNHVRSSCAYAYVVGVLTCLCDCLCLCFCLCLCASENQPLWASTLVNTLIFHIELKILLPVLRLVILQRFCNFFLNFWCLLSIFIVALIMRDPLDKLDTTVKIMFQSVKTSYILKHRPE